MRETEIFLQLRWFVSGVFVAVLDGEELVSITDVLPRMKYLKFEKFVFCDATIDALKFSPQRSSSLDILFSIP